VHNVQTHFVSGLHIPSTHPPILALMHTHIQGGSL